jgi:hypothetical protein
MNKNTILKGILPLAVLPLLFWGCSDDQFGSDSSSGKQISFRLQGNLPSSRTTGTTVENINAFVVNAQAYGDSDNNGTPDTDPLPADAGKLFTSQTVARLEGTANAFDYSPKRYYPDAAAFAYYSAYSPVTGNVNKGFNTDLTAYPDYINTITYFVPAPDINGNTTQEDLLVAYTPVEGAIQPSGGKPVHRGGFESPVQLTFKHALSRVFVKASNKNKEPVVITGLILHNLYSTGELKIDGDTWGSANGTADINDNYKAITTAADYKVLWNSDGYDQNKSYEYVLLKTGVSVPAGTEDPVDVVGKDQGMLVLPQTTKNADGDAEPTGDDFYVEVIYSISNVREKKVRAAFTDLNGKPDTGLTFEMGRQYALTLEFTDAAVEFDISVESWEADEQPASAATTVVFDGNKPAKASASDAVEHLHDTNSGFIYGQDLPALYYGYPTGENPAPDTDAPTLAGYVFLGYYDARDGGTQYFGADADGKLIVADDNGTFVGGTWDKIGPSCTLYAHWEEYYPLIAQSNIYFQPDDPSDPDCSVGSLTFFEKGATLEQQGYQGLYFKWGSLIGVAAGPNGSFTGATYLYIPYISTGKYYKVKVSEVTSGYENGSNSDMTAAVGAFRSVIGSDMSSGGSTDWYKIPYVTSGTTADRSFNYLASVTVHTPADYQGDICKFLSDTKVTNGSGLTRTWVMPKSEIWGGKANTGYTFDGGSVTVEGAWLYTWTDYGTANTTADGAGGTLNYLTFTIKATNESATFPASGFRIGGDGALDGVGYYGICWGSSVSGASSAYDLVFYSSGVDPAYGDDDRAYGPSVRCVQN